MQIVRIKVEGGAMRGFGNGDFDPQTLVLLETTFDEAWLTLRSVGNKTVKPDELARAVLRLAMEGERDPIRGARPVDRGVTEPLTCPRTEPDNAQNQHREYSDVQQCINLPLH
jgi:hypothetical protein